MDSLDDAENNKAEIEEGTDVYFEIISNWGNSSYVGLTEVCNFLSCTVVTTFETEILITVRR